MPSLESTAALLSIVILGTCDTKLSEILYLRSQILAHAEDASITLIDVSRSPVSDPAISISQDELLSRYGSTPSSDLSSAPRNKVMQTMTECATAYLQELHSTTAIHGVISIGGSSGTSLTSAAMRHALPFLLPKLIVSTVASGDTAPFVGESDITLMYSIVDIAGSNHILNGVLDNAAGGIVGMARAYQKRQSPSSQQQQNNNGDSAAGDQAIEPQKKEKKRIGITMFGVTTPCVDTIRHHLTSPSSNPRYDYEIYVFHATGHGGQAMERLISSRALDAIIDLTTTEIADELVGGNMSAGPQRLEAAAKAGIPQIISFGACDIVNFGPRNTIPPKFLEQERKIYEHNSSVTLVRTNREECQAIGEFVVEKLKRCCARPEVVQVVQPRGGMSVLSKRGGVYEDKEADRALFEHVEAGLRDTGVEVLRDEREVNDEGFARDVADRLVRLIEKAEGKGGY
ncbi:MAG: hypothetical protein Q9201_003316 [Fulgogasparrea decipioides]